jgi:hypothetical protein
MSICLLRTEILWSSAAFELLMDTVSEACMKETADWSECPIHGGINNEQGKIIKMD